MTHAESPIRQTFLEVMAGVCTPVAVVTTLVDDGPHGTTVSAFSSLSLDPPMALVALDKQSLLLELTLRSGRFGLNVLATDHRQLALTFARKGHDKFAEVAWHLEHGVPRLPAAAGFLACEVDRVVEGGDHVVLFGKVLRATVGAGAPLTYHARSFGTHLALDEALS